MPWPFGKSKKKEQTEPPAGRSMSEFLDDARREVRRQADSDPRWFENLPYQGGMSREDALEFEAEKRAMFRRVIYDAQRSELHALKWMTRDDKLVCPDCAVRHGKVYSRDQFEGLATVNPHLGCRCELVPERS